ncbi:MAG TPA: hypothetical protein GXZ30_00425 [Propionibacterium sp.]|jgi:hypothetical protein|nr:hypothetical protein [Propionibacterium sp.]
MADEENKNSTVAGWDTEDDSDSTQGMITLGVIAAAAIAFLAVCLPLFIL